MSVKAKAIYKGPKDVTCAVSAVPKVKSLGNCSIDLLGSAATCKFRGEELENRADCSLQDIAACCGYAGKAQGPTIFLPYEIMGYM